MALSHSPRTSPEVYSITGARTSRQADLDRRKFRYALSMGIRSICFPLALVTPGAVRWTFIGAALVLPYVAILIANAGRERLMTPRVMTGRPQREPITTPALTAAPTVRAGDGTGTTHPPSAPPPPRHPA